MDGRDGWYVFVRKGAFKIVKGFALITFETEASSLPLEIKLYFEGGSSLKKGKIFSCIVP